ncbi:DinB family protein [Mucilaginibacter sp. McL0603]|uniref:DinB family protein n=1 Tax=Mucilaginibacter sp. McL0603 TaxID=3415670 RepID=UPI003CF570B5
MKAYFIQLFNYDRYANLRIIETIIKVGDAEKPVQLMAHMLAAQQIWLKRCKGEPTTGSILWPDWRVDTFVQLLNDNHQKWISFLEGLNDDDFEKKVSYKDLRGNSFENKLSDVLAHAINHGTHHRAQAGQHLKLAGNELPNTDYILYIRELK